MRPQNKEDCPVGYEVGETVEVTTEDVAQGGWCVARPAGFPVLFVRHALPGERVIARVTEVTSRFARADAVEILQPSPDRVEPPCRSARPGGCGGCDWQHASLPAQRALKAAVIGQHLRRLAGVDRAVTVEPMPGDEPAPAAGTAGTAGTADGLGWRTRVQFAVREDGVAGLRAHRSHEVIDIGDCLIAHPRIRELGIPRRDWPDAAAVEAVVGSAGPGGNPAERTVIITPAGHAGRRGAAPKTAPKTGSGTGDSRGRGGVSPFRSEDRNVATVPAESVLSRAGHRLTSIRGRGWLSQRAAGREWRVSAGAFWQVHPAAAGTLSAAVLAALDPKPGDAVLDLYCGAGLFAGAAAALVGPDGTVVGVESDQAAVRDARHNLRDWPWARVHRGDVAQVLRHTAMPPARLAVADPPRAGLAREVIDYVSKAPALERFAYVSCDPATLARDLGLLLARGWALEELRAFDAFPMTHHVECVATLTS
jgi:tRNA/tmRNA/rRNA uracil-C5-methylase (TrmA/RlmC/RlmD family)